MAIFTMFLSALGTCLFKPLTSRFDKVSIVIREGSLWSPCLVKILLRILLVSNCYTLIFIFSVLDCYFVLLWNGNIDCGGYSTNLGFFWWTRERSPSDTPIGSQDLDSCYNCWNFRSNSAVMRDRWESKIIKLPSFML